MKCCLIVDYSLAMLILMILLYRLNVKGLYSASHHGRRSSSEDEEEDKVEAVPNRSGFSSNFYKVGIPNWKK